jgi:hypothetical protein
MNEKNELRLPRRTGSEEGEDNQNGIQHMQISPKSSTVSVNQTTNGTRTTLHYPIVTEPSRRRSGTGRSAGSSFKDTLRKTAKEFLGLDSDDSDQEALWTERRIRLANRLYGGVDPATAAATLTLSRPVLRIRIHRIHMFLGLLDPDPLVRSMDPDPAPDPSIIKQK